VAPHYFLCGVTGQPFSGTIPVDYSSIAIDEIDGIMKIIQQFLVEAVVGHGERRCQLVRFFLVVHETERFRGTQNLATEKGLEVEPSSESRKINNF